MPALTVIPKSSEHTAEGSVPEEKCLPRNGMFDFDELEIAETTTLHERLVMIEDAGKPYSLTEQAQEHLRLNDIGWNEPFMEIKYGQSIAVVLSIRRQY